MVKGYSGYTTQQLAALIDNTEYEIAHFKVPTVHSGYGDWTPELKAKYNKLHEELEQEYAAIATHRDCPAKYK